MWHTLTRLLALLVCTQAAVAWADVTFNYEPNSPVSLARSIDVRIPTETKRDCLSSGQWIWVESEPASATVPSGVSRVAITSKYTDNYREIYQQLHLNASYKVSAAVSEAVTAGGSGTITFDNEFNGKYGDFAFVTLAKYDFGSRRLAQPGLKAEFQKLIDEKKFAQFVAACGTHYVDQEERWAYVSLIAGGETLDETMKRKLSGNYKSKVTVSEVGSTETEIDLSAQFNEIRRYGKATLDFRARGGDSTKAAKLASAAQASNVTAAVAAMEQYLGGVSRETSAVKSYRLVSFSLYGLEFEEDPRQAQFLEAVYYSAVRYQNMLATLTERIEELGRNASAAPRLLNRYKVDFRAITLEKAALDRLALKCVKDNICVPGDITKAAPRIGYNFSTLQSLTTTASCLYDGQDLDSITVKLSGTVTDPSIALGLDAYRLPDGERKQQAKTYVIRSRFDADLQNRFIARIDYLDRTTIPNIELADRARKTRYEIVLSTANGGEEWYDLGTLDVRADQCLTQR